MPLTKFKQIKNLAVFKDFDWDSSIRDSGNNIVSFNPINIFYGRNYSGKTTLSRIVRSLELGRISDKYEDPDFIVSFQGQADVSQTNLTGHSKKIRVFNEDFIKENLKFITNPDENVVPFAILGGNAAIEEEIQRLENELGQDDQNAPTGFYLEVKKAREEYSDIKSRHTSAAKQLDDQLSDKATDKVKGIKYKPERYGDQNYNKTKLLLDITDALDKGFEVVSNDEVDRFLKLLDEKPSNPIQSVSIPTLTFAMIANDAKKLIEKAISESGKIEQLVKDAILNRWVKEGKKLHQNQLKDCAFCGNEIGKTRWAQLDTHFDEESDKLSKDIEALISRIEEEIESCKLIIQKDIFYSKFQNNLHGLELVYQKKMKLFTDSLENLKGQLIKRKDDIINPGIFLAPVDYSKKITQLYSIYNHLIRRANKYTSLLSNDQASARKKLRQREVYDFVTTIRYTDESEKISKLKEELDKKETIGKEIAEKIKEHLNLIEDNRRLMNDEEKGALKVNEYLNNYFGHDFLTLQAIEETDEVSSAKKIKFEIVREGKKAHHLSEGECSLIAFCYFMARLEDIETKGGKPIVWIDDPISSLDGNHIFFIYSLINSEIVSKLEFEQLFISTHNLDFLKYLKRLPRPKETTYFLVVRDSEKSVLKLMPKYLKDYVTEFNYLFHQIYNCANAKLDDENHHFVFYNFSNNTRKFLEAFLFYKYPNAIEKDDKLLRFFGNNRQASTMIDRINNEYSHLDDTDRMIKMCKQIIKDKGYFLVEGVDLENKDK
ncbi:MAG: AAA family ATPase [Bacteroidota bacterium]